MVSISLFVLLLATYCYSVPIERRVDSSTEIELTTGITIVDHENKINMRLMTDEESTDVPNIHKERSVMVDKDELTTPESSEHHHEHDHEHMSRSFEESSLPIKSDLEHPSSDETDIHHSLDKFHVKTMETKSHFEKKTIVPEKLEVEEEGEPEIKRSLPVDDLETTTDKDLPSTTYKMDESHEHSKEHTSSVDSFGKMTGLLTDKRTEKEKEKREDEEIKKREDEETKKREDEEPKKREDEKTEKREDEDIKKREDEETKKREDEETKKREDEKTEKREDEDIKKREDEEPKKREDEEPKKREDEEPRKREDEEPKKREDEEPKKREDESREETKKREDGSSEETTTKLSEKLMEKHEDQSHEESTTHLLEIVPLITKTETILPIKITETKIYAEKQPIVDKKKPDH